MNNLLRRYDLDYPIGYPHHSEDALAALARTSPVNATNLMHRVLDMEENNRDNHYETIRSLSNDTTHDSVAWLQNRHITERNFQDDVSGVAKDIGFFGKGQVARVVKKIRIW